MPERYNFVTENIDELEKAIAIAGDLGEFSENVIVNKYLRYDRRLAYFITGQSIEIDSNCGPIELRSLLEGERIAAVFINHPSETGTINCE